MFIYSQIFEKLLHVIEILVFYHLVYTLNFIKSSLKNKISSYTYNTIYFTELSHGHTRLSIVLFGFEYHIYNRTSTYDNLRELFEQKKATTKIQKPKKC